MKKTILFSLLFALMFSCTDDRDIKTNAVIIDPNSILIYYWNFNSLSGTVTEVFSDYSATAFDAKISYPGNGEGYMDAFDPGYILNARKSDIEGSGLRARNPSNTRSLIIDLPTTGYKKIVLQFAVARSGSGATVQNYTYSVDGTTYTAAGLAVNTFNPDQDPSLAVVTIDFTTIPNVDNNPDFKFKIDFDGANASGASGNNRFDNVTLEGVPLDIVPPDPNVYLFQYWNFNSLPSGTLTAIVPDSSLIPANTAHITYAGTGAGYMDQYSPASALNAQNGDPDGLGLRVRNPSDTKSLLIAAPTTGYKDIIVKFATAKSSASGASVQNYLYSVDGITFISTGLSTATFSPNVDPAYDIITLDFSAIPAASNNPDFVIKINFAGNEAAGTSGNNRFDNITFQGHQL